MLRSMTGYGKSSLEFEKYSIETEIKSVNHRFLDLNFRIPSAYNSLEMKLREKVKKYISRGSLSIYLTVNTKTVQPAEGCIDMNAARSYKENLEKMKDELGIDQPVTLDILLKFPGVISSGEETEGSDVSEAVTECFEGALKELSEYREKEGANIYEDLELRINELETLTGQVASAAVECSSIQYERLLTRLKNFTETGSFSKERLEQEMVLICDKVDISEEISRLNSHVALFRDTINSEAPAGKTINNLAQEMHREASTISAKTNLTEISHLSVKMKDIIEMIREQAQNVE